MKYMSSTEYNTNCTLSDRREIMSIYAARNKFATHAKFSGTVVNKLSNLPLRLHNHFHYSLLRHMTLFFFYEFQSKQFLGSLAISYDSVFCKSQSHTHINTDTYTVEILLSKTFHNIK